MGLRHLGMSKGLCINSDTLTTARDTKTTNPKMEKYAMNAGRWKSLNRSSNDRVCSGTIPKKAMRIAPPAMKMVPRIIHGENTSPKSKRAKNAFQSKDTAPNGARMTTGRDAIWTNEPSILDEMNMAKPNNHSLFNGQCGFYGT